MNSINKAPLTTASTPSAISADEPLASTATQRKLRAVHIVSGDRWAGAEVQVFTLLKQLHPQLDIHLIILNHGELARRCEALGISVTVLDENQLPAFKLFNAIRKRLSQIRPDIIHSHRQKENIIGSIANLFSCRVPCLRTVHGAPEFQPTWRQKLQQGMDGFCGRYLQQGIIAVSADLKEKLEGSFSPNRIHVIPNGIDPDEVRTDAQPALQFSSGRAVHHVGLVGRLESVKRPDLFIDMAAILIRSNPNQWRFHIFGDGSQAALTKEKAQQLGIEEQFEFHGHRQDIRRAIAALDAVVMPSDHEGLPMTALEALALGVRLIAHDTGGLRELLVNHPHFLVSQHSAEGYANAVQSTMNYPPANALKSGYLAASNAEQVFTLYQTLSQGTAHSRKREHNNNC